MEESIRSKPDLKSVTWIGAILLLLVGYIHLSLVTNMFGLHARLGILFTSNVIGAVVALILIFTRLRALGWILGIVVAGGAAFAKSTISSIPGLRRLLMGRSFPGGRLGGGGLRGSRALRSANGGGHGGAGGFPSGNVAAGGGRSGNFGSAVSPRTGHFFVARHNVLPQFFNLKSLGTVSIVIEVLFVIVAIYALVAMGRRRSHPPITDENVKL